MATFASLFHHLIDHVPGLSETNRQEYHDMIDEFEKDPEAEPSGQEPDGQKPQE